MTDIMKEQILSQLAPDYPWGELLHTYGKVDSTNTLAKSMAAAGAPHGTAIIATHQTGGRGRMGRQFFSPEDAGVYLSLILRPQCAAAELMHLTCAAAVAACQAAKKAAGVELGIKWINDLIWNKRKIAGILTELSLEPGTGKVSYAVIGIGINCLQLEGDFPPELRESAGSLAMAAGKKVSPAAVAAEILNEFYRMYQVLLTEKAALMELYRSRCVTVGQPVRILRGEEISFADAVGVDGDGALLVRSSDGSISAISSGEASIRGTDGYL